MQSEMIKCLDQETRKIPAGTKVRALTDIVSGGLVIIPSGSICELCELYDPTDFFHCVVKDSSRRSLHSIPASYFTRSQVDEFRPLTRYSTQDLKEELNRRNAVNMEKKLRLSSLKVELTRKQRELAELELNIEELEAEINKDEKGD